MRINTRRLQRSWTYDFRAKGKRYRKGGFSTKAEATAEGQAHYESLLNRKGTTTLAKAYKDYTTGTELAIRTREAYARCWERIEPVLGHLFIEEVTTEAMDEFKKLLPEDWAPKTINLHLSVISGSLTFARKREKLKFVPYVPRVAVPDKTTQWYPMEEREELLAGMYELFPRWYLFFYLSMRLGLRTGEVYPIEREQLRDNPLSIAIDRAAIRGEKERPAQIVPYRKNEEQWTLLITPDVWEAVQWHIDRGYAGERFLFLKNRDALPKHLDSHRRPLRIVQRAKGLRYLSHHKIGRHSVGGQSSSAGISTRVLQSQLGHKSIQSTARYANLANFAQLKLLQDLAPATPPHGQPAVNEAAKNRAKKVL